MKEKGHKSDGNFIACITMLSNCFYFILTLILLEIDSMPGGTLKKKSRKYMNKNIGCNILIVG
jgi:hypothetical protein